MKVWFQGITKVVREDEDDNEEVITSPDQLIKLDGLIHDSKFTDYLFDGVGTEDLIELNVTGGEIGLKYSDNKVYYYIDYNVERRPNDTQIQTFIDDIKGQISDGIGPNFSGDCEDKTGLYPILITDNIEVTISENT